MTPDPRKRRIRKLLVAVAVVLMLGIGYALLLHFTGAALPCPIRRLTGYECPGCGVTRMCMSLLSGDIESAWHYNAAIMCAIPMGIAVAADLAYRYVGSGTKRLHPWANALVWIMIVGFLAFGILRNIA